MIIRRDIVQGSAEWRALHVGIPSASQFHRILSPGGKPSEGRKKYIAQLAAEYFYGDHLGGDTDSQFMARGREMEPRARARYELDHDCEVETVGCIIRDDGMALCSPDGLVIGRSKGVEFKTYELVHHVGAALQTDNSHYVQVMGCMLLSGCDEWDRVYYHPRFPSTTFTFRRSEHEDYLDTLSLALDLFISDVLAARRHLESKGWVPVRRIACEHSGVDALVCRCEHCDARRAMNHPAPDPTLARQAEPTPDLAGGADGAGPAFCFSEAK